MRERGREREKRESEKRASRARPRLSFFLRRSRSKEADSIPLCFSLILKTYAFPLFAVVSKMQNARYRGAGMRLCGSPRPGEQHVILRFRRRRSRTKGNAPGQQRICRTWGVAPLFFRRVGSDPLQRQSSSTTMEHPPGSNSARKRKSLFISKHSPGCAAASITAGTTARSAAPTERREGAAAAGAAAARTDERAETTARALEAAASFIVERG